MHKKFSRLLAVLSLSAFAGLALAGPVPAGLSIVGKVSLDTVNTADPSGGATLGGALSHTAGGSTTTAAFSGGPGSWGTNSLTGNLLQTGDQIGIRSLISGSFGNGPATADPFWADYSLVLSNSSATQTFTLLFRAVYENVVLATGPDAFAYSDLVVYDSANNELIYTDQRADTVNAVASSNSAATTFLVTLAPGQSASFSAVQHQMGGAFFGGSDFSATLDAMLRLEEIRSSGGGTNDVPLPGTLPLALVGLLALRRAGRRSSISA